MSCSKMLSYKDKIHKRTTTAGVDDWFSDTVEYREFNGELVNGFNKFTFQPKFISKKIVFQFMLDDENEELKSITNMKLSCTNAVGESCTITADEDYFPIEQKVDEEDGSILYTLYLNDFMLYENKWYGVYTLVNFVDIHNIDSVTMEFVIETNNTEAINDGEKIGNFALYTY